jgi:hypothetical protein
MSTILVNTLTGTSTAGSIAVTGEGNSTTTNLQQGLAKCWCKWNASVTVDDSFNQSSMVDVGTGDYEVVFTNSFGSASSFAAGGLGGQQGTVSGFMTWTGGGNNNTHADRIKVQFQNSSGSPADCDKNTIIITGDLA